MNAGKIAISFFFALAMTAGGRLETASAAAPAGADKATVQLAQAAPPARPAASSRWKLGKHYTTVKPPQPTSVGPDKIEVIEVFWYGCPHCYALEPYLQAWEPKKAANIQFIRIPATWGPWHQMHARLFYTLMALNHPELHIVAFREAQFSDTLLLGPDIASTERIHTSFARRHGIDEARFKEAYNSKAVLDKVKEADELIRRYKLDSVPIIIVNGKYKADVASAGGHSQLISLINDLAAQESQGKP